MYFVTFIKFKVEDWYSVFSRFLGKFKIIDLENSDSSIYFVGNVPKWTFVILIQRIIGIPCL